MDAALDILALAAVVAGLVRRAALSEPSMERIHGPAGLDIDAHTPAEIAVSIVAEILSSRSASSGGALRDRPGPVHVAGVRTPPPRYPTT